MRLVALKIAEGAPTDAFNGVVRSVFAKAAILTIADRFVTLAPATAGGLPGAISVDLPPSINLADVLRVGAPAAARAGVLRFGAAAISIDLREAVVWRSRLREISIELTNSSVEQAWRGVAASLRADGRSAAIARLGRSAIAALCEATRRFALRNAVEAAALLVGLGAGGTPAGDDLLVGFLAGLWSSISAAPTRADFVEGFARGLRGLMSRTNDVSRVYLAAAADGEASERLVAVAASVAAGSSGGGATEATAAAIAVGHTSGADGVLGLLLGLSAWGPDPIFRDGRRLIEQEPGNASD